MDKPWKTLGGDFIHSLFTAPGPDMQQILDVELSINLLIYKGIVKLYTGLWVPNNNNKI